MLGPPGGGSPACNRALVTDSGSFDLAVPPGQLLRLRDARTVRRARSRRCQLAPGTSADHAAGRIAPRQLLPTRRRLGRLPRPRRRQLRLVDPRRDRVSSFLATGVDVIIATDHNVVTELREHAGRAGRHDSSIVVIPGVEQTPNILWYYVPGDRFPKTLGPFQFLAAGPRLSADPQRRPLAELREPGPVDGRHGAAFLRRACGSSITPTWGQAGTRPGLPASDWLRPDHTHPGDADRRFHLRGERAGARAGGNHRNIDWDVEEVMTGASRADWLRYRALWFSLLNQGFKRVGTANSDSHSLSIERIGYPRNLVWGGHDQGTFDLDSFDADVRAGHLEGTNGPVLDVTIDDGGGDSTARTWRPSPSTRGHAQDLRRRRTLDPGDRGAGVRQRRAGAHVRPLAPFPSGTPSGSASPRARPSVCSSPRCPPPRGRLAGRRGRASTRSRPPTPTATVCPICPDATLPSAARLDTTPLRSASHRARRLAHGLQQSVLPRPRRRRLDRAGAAVRRSPRGADPPPRRRRAGRARRAARASAARAAFEAAAGPLAGGTELNSRRLRRRARGLPGTDLCSACAASARLPRRARLLGRHRRHLDPPAPRRLNARTWLSLAFDLLTYRYVINAGLAAPGLAFGPPTLGHHRALAAGSRTAAAVYGRALLPLDTARANGVETGLELGAAAARGSPRWWPMEGVSLAGPLVVIAGQAHGLLQPAALVEGWFAPVPGFARLGGPQPRFEVSPAGVLTLAHPRAGRLALRTASGRPCSSRSRWAGEDRTNRGRQLFWGGPRTP